MRNTLQESQLKIFLIGVRWFYLHVFNKPAPKELIKEAKNWWLEE